MKKLVERIGWRRGLAEMGIVVLGILIALAADDWYAGRQDRAREATLVQGLYDDVAADRAALEAQLELIAESEAVLNRLIGLIDRPREEVGDTAEYLRMLKQATVAYYFQPATTTFQELTGSGSVSAISNRELMRAYIEYLGAAEVTANLNAYVRQVKWFDYNEVLAETIEPTLLPELTRDLYQSLDQWPEEDGGLAVTGLDLTPARSSQRFRTVLARGLDASVVQRGDAYRMLGECERVLALAEQELVRMGVRPDI